MEKFAEFARAVLDFILRILWLIYMFFAFIFGMIGNFFKNLELPIMPTLTRVFQESWIVIGLFAIVLVIFLAINISAFNLFRKDKIMAQSLDADEAENMKRYTRISERRLFRRCFAGGAIGGYLAMKICRHKTLKPKFNIGVAILALIQLLLFSIIIGYLTFWMCLA
ncbi:MAG: DUF1294 domain-containing protein [Clostridia bacterium]|nr:DUF1294 domain-containing protein [Clostridia bacterium]